MRLPMARGPVSDAVIAGLQRGRIPQTQFDDVDRPLVDDDLQLALWVCNELSYRGFDGVDDDAEWDPGMLTVRRRLESIVSDALRQSITAPRAEPGQVSRQLTELIDGWGGPDLSGFLAKTAGHDQFVEFVVHRSIYHVKEADPHSWGIPRLDGAAKAALIAIQADEYGNGILSRMHSELFRRMMRSLALDDSYGAYVDYVPGITLAVSNLMTMFGLHRSLRGALVGHLAVFEMTSSLPNRAYSRGLRRLGGTPAARGFFEEHITADALHEQLAARDLCGGLAAQEPELADDILFGAACCLHLDELFAEHVLTNWRNGASSLVSSIPAQQLVG